MNENNIVGASFERQVRPHMENILDLIASRAIDLIARNSLRVAVNVAIAVVSISLTTVIVQSLMSGLMGVIPPIH